VHQHAGSDAQDPRAPAAQTPSLAGGGLHPYPRDLHAVVGESVEQQEHLGLRKRITREAARERRLALVWGTGWRRWW